MNQDTPLLRISNLSISFTQYISFFRQASIEMVSDLSLEMRAGEVLAVLGASGSGKSLLAHSILGLLPRNAQQSGEVWFDGEPLTPPRQKALRGKEIALIPQGVSYLDPLQRTGSQLAAGRRDPATKARVTSLLRRYGLPEDTARRFPFELSGGMARRVLIASALVTMPRLVIADEPTPGLHPEATQRVLGHLREIADQGAAVLLITHDLEPTLRVADRLLVFYAGTVVEEALARDFAKEENLRHPYTRALWRALPCNGLHALPGSQPYAAQRSPGCLFADRCHWKTDACAGKIPYRGERGGYVRCVRSFGEEGSSA